MSVEGLKWKNKKYTSIHLPSYLNYLEIKNIAYTKTLDDFSDVVVKLSLQELGLRPVRDTIISFELDHKDEDNRKIFRFKQYTASTWSREKLRLFKSIYDYSFPEAALKIRLTFQTYYKSKLSLSEITTIRKLMNSACLNQLILNDPSSFFQKLILSNFLTERKINKICRLINPEINFCKLLKVKVIRNKS